MLDLETRSPKLLISLLYSKFVLTHESPVSLFWNFQSSPNYTPRFAHATLYFLGSKGGNSLECHMLFILAIISLSMSTSTYKTTCRQFGNH